MGLIESAPDKPQDTVSMSVLTCVACHSKWEASQRPTCPACQAMAWQSSSGLVRPKHDPQFLSWRRAKTRSVLPFEFAASPAAYLNFMAYNASAFQSIVHRDWFDFAVLPSSLVGGSAVPSGATVPASAYNGLLIAQAYQPQAHLYAENLSIVESRLAAGEFIPVQTCSSLGCLNLCAPPSDWCAQHCTPPLANG
jgi:hypothetical protein